LIAQDRIEATPEQNQNSELVPLLQLLLLLLLLQAGVRI